jgi:hypothetical protein
MVTILSAFSIFVIASLFFGTIESNERRRLNHCSRLLGFLNILIDCWFLSVDFFGRAGFLRPFRKGRRNLAERESVGLRSPQCEETDTDVSRIVCTSYFPAAATANAVAPI